MADMVSGVGGIDEANNRLAKATNALAAATEERAKKLAAANAARDAQQVQSSSYPMVSGQYSGTLDYTPGQGQNQRSKTSVQQFVDDLRDLDPEGPTMEKVQKKNALDFSGGGNPREKRYGQFISDVRDLGDMDPTHAGPVDSGKLELNDAAKARGVAEQERYTQQIKATSVALGLLTVAVGFATSGMTAQAQQQMGASVDVNKYRQQMTDFGQRAGLSKEEVEREIQLGESGNLGAMTKEQQLQMMARRAGTAQGKPAVMMQPGKEDFLRLAAEARAGTRSVDQATRLGGELYPAQAQALEEIGQQERSKVGITAQRSDAYIENNTFRNTTLAAREGESRRRMEMQYSDPANGFLYKANRYNIFTMAQEYARSTGQAKDDEYEDSVYENAMRRNRWNQSMVEGQHAQERAERAAKAAEATARNTRPVVIPPSTNPTAPSPPR